MEIPLSPQERYSAKSNSLYIFRFNRFPSHHVAPPNLYFNCDSAQAPPPPPPPPYNDNYGIASTHNFHSPSLSHYHPYHNAMPSAGLGYDFEHNHNQSYYSPVTTLDSYNQLTNNNSIGIKSNEPSGYYGTNATFSHGYGSQVPPPILQDHIKTETDSNHSQHLNSGSETSDSPVASSNHSHCEYTPNHLDFNRTTNQLNGSRSPVVPSKFGPNALCSGNNSSKFPFDSKMNRKPNDLHSLVLRFIPRRLEQPTSGDIVPL